MIELLDSFFFSVESLSERNEQKVKQGRPPDKSA